MIDKVYFGGLKQLLCPSGFSLRCTEGIQIKTGRIMVVVVTIK